jgi:hypothetical protein
MVRKIEDVFNKIGWKLKFAQMARHVHDKEFLSHYMSKITLTYVAAGLKMEMYVPTRVNSRAYSKFLKSSTMKNSELTAEHKAKLATKYLSYAVTCVALPDIFIISLILCLDMQCVIRLRKEAGYNRVIAFKGIRATLNIWDIIKTVVGVHDIPNDIICSNKPKCSWDEIEEFLNHTTLKWELTKPKNWEEGVIPLKQWLIEINEQLRIKKYFDTLTDDKNEGIVIFGLEEQNISSEEYEKEKRELEMKYGKQRIIRCIHISENIDFVHEMKHCKYIYCRDCLQKARADKRLYNTYFPQKIIIVDY